MCVCGKEIRLRLGGFFTVLVFYVMSTQQPHSICGVTPVGAWQIVRTLCLKHKLNWTWSLYTPRQTKPNQTKPNQTKPNQTKPKKNLLFGEERVRKFWIKNPLNCGEKWILFISQGNLSLTLSAPFASPQRPHAALLKHRLQPLHHCDVVCRGRWCLASEPYVVV